MVTNPAKKHIDIIIDFCTYTPAVLQATLDMAVAAKRTGYADIRVMVPPSLLYEISGYKAMSNEQLQDHSLHKDKGVRALRAMFEYGMKEQVLQIPKCTQGEYDFFKNNGVLHRKRNTVSVAGPRSPSDFADFAIVEWLKNHQPDVNHHVIISSRDNGMIAGSLGAIKGDPHAPDHLNYFEFVDQKCMALWLAEEAKPLKAHASAQSHQPGAETAIHQLEGSLAKIANIESGRASNTKKVEKYAEQWEKQQRQLKDSPAEETSPILR